MRSRPEAILSEFSRASGERCARWSSLSCQTQGNVSMSEESLLDLAARLDAALLADFMECYRRVGRCSSGEAKSPSARVACAVRLHRRFLESDETSRRARLAPAPP